MIKLSKLIEDWLKTWSDNQYEINEFISDYGMISPTSKGDLEYWIMKQCSKSYRVAVMRIDGDAVWARGCNFISASDPNFFSKLKTYLEEA